MATPDQLLAAYQRATSAVVDRAVKFATILWQASPSLRDPDVARIVSRVVPVVGASQLQAARLANAYVNGVAREVGLPASTVVAREVVEYRGVPAPVVYQRPAMTTYTALAAGSTFQEAKKAGLVRLVSLVTTDIQQSKNRQAHYSMRDSGFSGYQRVLTGRENCALCVIASTQRYHRSDLMPIHPSCDCDVEPYLGDPRTHVINQRLLNQTYGAMEAKFGSHFTDSASLRELVVTNQHGELGPTLGWASDKFTGPAAIKAAA